MGVIHHTKSEMGEQQQQFQTWQQQQPQHICGCVHVSTGKHGSSNKVLKTQYI